MTTSLYDMAQAFVDLEAALEASEGELTPEIEARLTALGDLEGDKVDAYRHVVRTFERLAADCKAERDVLRAKQDVAERTVARLKERLKAYMEFRGVAELKGHIWRATIQRNGGRPPLELDAAFVENPGGLPTPLQKVEPNVDAIRGLQQRDDGALVWTDGMVIGRLGPVGSHLRFR